MNLIQYILQYVLEHNLVHMDTISSWTDHASSIDSEDKVEEWMMFVKRKIGATMLNDIQKEFENHKKKDCGFVKCDPMALVTEMQGLDS